MNEIEQGINEMVKNFEKIGYKHNIRSVFSDFVEIAAISISNSVDRVHWKEREQKYLDTIKKYDKTELNLFAENFAKLVLVMNACVAVDDFKDILGTIFEERLNMGSERNGQIFTPETVCKAMARMSFGENEKSLLEKNYITVLEPACGSGRMIYAFAETMKHGKFNYCKNLLVTAIDIDRTCALMTYVQLSLYGIPALVLHGDILALEEYSRWYTPVFVVDGWVWKNAAGMVQGRNADDERLKMILEPLYGSFRELFGYGNTIEYPKDNPTFSFSFDFELDMEQVTIFDQSTI